MKNAARKDGRIKASVYHRLRRMVIPPFTAHWLRHIFVTNMYMAGVDVSVERNQAGHDEIKTTLDIYTTSCKECHKSDMTKPDNYISGKISEKSKNAV